MDILGHVAYGATLCSRTGLGGGRGGFPAGRVWRDGTVWAAAAFAAFPDLLSIGVAFAEMAVRGESISFHSLPSYVFTLYRYTHSLITAGLGVLLLRWVARPVVLPALAWPLHILMDSVLHDDGRWQTPMLFPFSDWHVPGINWWQHPEVVLLYWAALPLVWIAIRLWRRQAVASGSLTTPR
jgi:hypothetical protein